MRKSLFIISAAAVLLTGCAKEQLVEQKAQNGPVHVVSATFEDLVGDDATKAAVSDAGTFTWQNGDKAAFAGESAYLEAQNSSTTATASFSYSGTLASSTFGIFPFDLTTGQSVNDGKVKVPTSRAWAENQTNVAMYATYASNNFNFEHLGGLVKVTINNIPTTANKFVFKTKGWKINGVFNIGTDTDSKKIISTSSTTTGSEMEYTLTFTAPESAGTSKIFYIPLPVGTYDKGFAVYLKNSSGTTLSQFEGSTSQEVKRKSFLIMPAITLASASIEDVYKDALVETIPAGYSGDYLLPETDKLILKIKASSENHDITLKYKGENKPANLEIKVVDGDTENPGNFSAKLLGNLPSTHVDFTLGYIDATELTTSSSTFAVINPASVGTLTVKGGNVVLKGATVNMIEVAEGAVADASSSTPVEIKMEKYTPAGSTVQTPKVTGSVVAKANVQVAPVAGETVTVVKVGTVNVEDTGEGAIEEKDNEVSVSTFDKFKSAIDNVVAGQTIKVTATISDAQGITVAEGKNFTVDFDGHTYTGLDNPAGSTGTNNQVFQLLQNSTITFKNGTIDLATTNQDKFRFIIQNYANLTLENIILDGTNLAITDRDRYTISNNCGTVEFKGNTTIKAAAQRGIAFDVCKYGNYDAPKVTWSSSGSVDGEIELTGGEFILGHNLEVNQPVRVKAAATLNLGTYTLSGSSDFSKKGRGVVIVNRDGDLTIKGTTGIIDGATNEINAAVVLTEPEACDINTENLGKSAKLTVEGGTLKGYYYGISGNGNSNRHNTVITIKGGTIQGYKSDDCVGIYHPQGGELIISGGEIKGSTGLVLKGGNLTITGGEIKGIGTADSFVHNGSGWHNTGDALAVEVCDYPGQPLTVNINGGVFTSTNGNVVASYVQPDKGYEALTGFIHGGTFSDESAIKYAANGADINIALQANRNASGIFLGASKNVKVTFDLGSNTLNFVAPAVGSNGTENQAFHIEQGNQLFTLKNGKVTIDENAKTAFRFIIQNYNNLTVHNVELDGSNLGFADKTRYTVSNNQGTVNFTGSTSIKAASTNGIAFDVCKYASYDAPTVTWASSGSVTGEIELSGGTFVLGHNLAVKQPIKVIAPATLDLADYTLSAADGFTRPTAGVIIVNRKGDLTVKGNTEGAIDAKQVYAAVLMTEKTVDTQDTTNPAKLTVESGSLLGLNYGVVGNGSTGRGNTVITVTGGKIKGTSTESAGIYHPQNGTLTIAGGEIEGSTGIYVKSGDVITSVSAGTIKGTGAKNDYKPCTNGFQSTGDAIVFDNCGYPGGEPNAKISGGTFISTNAAQIGNYGYLPTYQPITIDYTGYQGTKPTERTNIE